MAEVMLGNLALQKTQNEQIRQFAQQMVTDHTNANNELKQLAESKNITLPSSVSNKQQSAYDKLNGMTGMNFDKAFMKQMVKDHEAAVKLFEKQSEKGEDAEAKAFAAKTLPTLRMHLQMAKTLNDSMKNSNRNNNDNSNSNSGGSSNGNMDMMNSNANSNMKNSNSNRNGNTNSNTNSNVGLQQQLKR
ncbi:DUF4142 domain-containing protein [Biomphalaria pfeifferi]|uniref:DUF4142 domain-containing protein n=1 Tax=Biomphalaria pfeifferi TaxID=112525 RepID=A0AAD8AP40_BIOPF|nr:DUF4142 domain-containing protein [Biomphalaria pfeifferi]